MLNVLKENFDYVVVDTAPTFDEHVLQAFDESDELLLVTTLDVPTLKNVKIALETLDLLNFPKEKRHLILNRADDKVGLSAEKVESTLGVKIHRSIPSSPQVANATNAGEPIFAASPKHVVSTAIAALAGDLSAPSTTQQAQNGVQSKSRGSVPKRGLLRRNRVGAHE